jgi:[lysine-biosynthesis-protein LysW]--L-2-aminoadipate ligase
MAAVGVLCTRVRVEEKQLLAALASAGVAACPFPPAPAAISISPLPRRLQGANGDGGHGPSLLIDRCQDRVLAAAVLPLLRASGAQVIDAGLAAASDRLAVATALAAAGVPRPRTMLISSEASGLGALAEMGYPATVLPLTPGEDEVSLCDRDVAEAVLEHRNVLGGSRSGVALIQAGGCDPDLATTVHVVGGHAVAFRAPKRQRPPERWLTIAEQAAAALGAAYIGVDIAMGADGPVVWDVQAAPDFRDAEPVDSETVARALASLAGRHVAPDNGRVSALGGAMAAEVTGVVALPV